VVASSGIKSSSIKGIGFDATCSLAVTSPTGSPVSVSPDSWAGPPSAPKDPDYVRDIILWADHRAHAEATLINATNSPVLAYVGGTMSLEMEIPKVLWLKNHMPAEVFNDCIFFDLPDWLTFRATGGDQSRSVCSLGCKCSYVPSPSGGDRGKEGWNKEFFHSIGLEQFVSLSFLFLPSFVLKYGNSLSVWARAHALAFHWNRYKMISPSSVPPKFSRLDHQSESVFRPKQRRN
jgi:ribulose kinase